MGINNRIRPGKDIFFLLVYLHIRYFMVVRHYDRKAVVLPVCNLIRCSDPVVTGDDRIDPVIDCPVDQINIKSVTVPDPVRNVCIHFCPQFRQPLLQNISRIHPIDVIIPDYPDPLLLTDFFREDFHRPVHIFHQHSVIEIRDRSIQIEINSFIPDNIPVADQPCKDRGDVIFLRNLIKVRFLHSDEPFFHI